MTAAAVRVGVGHGPLANTARHAVAVGLLFLLTYNIIFVAAPLFTTGRIALLILLLSRFPENAKAFSSFVRENQGVVAMYLVLCLYCFACFVTGGRVDSTQLSRFIHFIAYSVLGMIAYVTYIGNDWRKFHLYFAVAVFLQSCLHLYSMFSPEYRQWVAGILLQGGNFELTFALRPPGFANSAGASFSVIQALGVLSALVSASQARGAASVWLFLFAAAVSLLSTLISGRTGLMMSATFLSLFIMTGKPGTRAAAIGVILILIGVFVTFSKEIVFWLSLVDPAFERTFEYITRNSFEMLTSGSKVASVEDVLSMKIPALAPETLLGTGLIREPIGLGHDSGYVQLYYAIGLIMACAFYLTFYFLVGKQFARLRRWKVPMALVILNMVAIELKEPFIFKYVISFYVLANLRILTLERGPAGLPDAGQPAGTLGYST